MSCVGKEGEGLEAPEGPERDLQREGGHSQRLVHSARGFTHTAPLTPQRPCTVDLITQVNRGGRSEGLVPRPMTTASSSGQEAVDPGLPLHRQPSESQHSQPDGPHPGPHPGRDRRRHAEPRSQLPRQPQARDHSPMARLPAALGGSSPGNEGQWGTERAQPDPAGVRSPVPRDPARTRSRPHWCLFCSSFISGAPSAFPYWCTHLPVPGAPAEPGQQHTRQACPHQPTPRRWGGRHRGRD